MEYTDILVRKKDRVAIVTLNRPEALNALTQEMREKIGTIFQGFRTDDEVRAVVLTGAGRAFCAGGDVKTMLARSKEKGLGEYKHWVRNTIQRAVLAITSLEKPVVAMVNGAAVGAGCCLAMLCDLTIASEKAKFGMAFVKMGLGLDWGGSYFLPRRVGLAKAKELAFTGNLIDAKEAERIGLINQVVPPEELEATTMELAHSLAYGATEAIGTIKTMLDKSIDQDLVAATELEALAASILAHTEDHEEGIRASVEKRAPIFKGR